MNKNKIISLVLSFSVLLGGLFSFMPVTCSAKATPKKVVAKKITKKPIKKAVAKKAVKKPVIKKPTTPPSKPVTIKLPSNAEVYANRAEYIPGGREIDGNTDHSTYTKSVGCETFSMMNVNNGRLYFNYCVFSKDNTTEITSTDNKQYIVDAIRKVYGASIADKYLAGLNSTISKANKCIANGSISKEDAVSYQEFKYGNKMLLLSLYIKRDKRFEPAVNSYVNCYDANATLVIQD